MADNITVKNDAATTVDTLAADDIGSVKYPRSKITLGADGTNDGDVSSANPMPVTGTVTAVTTVGTITNVVHVDDNSGSLTVDNAALSVTGGGVESGAIRVTIASDSTGLVSVDDNGGSLTIDNAALSVTGGGVEASALRVTIASDSTGLVSVDDGGGSLTVDGSVSVSGVVPGTSATSLGKSEDAVAADGDTGVMALAVRKDTAATTVGADGDYHPLEVDGSGRLWTHVGTIDAGTITTVGAVTSITDALPAGTNAIGKLAANTGVTIGAVELAAAQTLATVTTVSTVTNVATIGTSVTPGTSAAHLGKAEDAGHSSGDTGVMALAVRNDTIAALAGTTADYIPITTDASGAIWTHPYDTVAHDAADAGNGIKAAAKATTSLSALTMVANNDRTDLFAGVDGVLLVRPHCNLEDVVQERTTNTDGASTAFASGLAAPGAGVRLWVKKVTIANSSSSFCTVDLRDGSAGSVLWTIPVPATGGVVETFDPPLRLTANTALAFDASAATSTLSISASGFKSKV